MSITREQAATWFETMHPPGPAAREMYRMAAEALREPDEQFCPIFQAIADIERGIIYG